jgi:serine/threonine-protein kinase
VGYRFIESVTSESEPAESERLRSLAIFPFHMLASKRDTVLELGLADTLITRLSRLTGLAVRSLASTRACLDSAEGRETLNAARALDVEFYLEASLQVHSTRLRVNARLVSTEDGAAIWSDSFDELASDIAELQDAICDQIAACIVPHVSTREGADGFAEPVPADAYRAFLEGRLFAGRYTHPGTLMAIERFERALDLAPNYAGAWAALGECHELLGIEGEDEAPQRYAAARRAASRALALSPHLPDAQSVLAKIAWQYDWNWAFAEETFRSVLTRCPNRADLRIHYVSFLCAIGRAEEAIDHARRAVAVDPVSPWCSSMLAQALHMSGRFEQAWRQADWTLELAPDFAFARLFSGVSRFCAGDRDTALHHLRKGTATGRLDFLAMVGYCAGVAGELDEARKVLARLENEGSAGPFSLGVAHLGCGQVAGATRFFRRCVERRDWHVLLVCSDPLFQRYREHADYGALRELIDSHADTAADE